MKTFNPLEHPNYPGFYTVPFTDWVAVSKDHQVISTVTGNVLTACLRNHGYLSINVKKRLDNGAVIERQFLLHRLIAGAFIPVPEGLQRFKRLQVNHKDGIKLNNDLENLEWIRPQQNMQHAFKNRLIDLGKRVLAKHVLTKEVTTYNSVSELAGDLDISAMMLRRHLESEYVGKQSIDWRVFKYDDGSDWPEIPNNWINPTTFNIKSAFLIKDLETGMVLLSKSLKTFCKIVGVVYQSLKVHRVRHGTNNVFRKRWDIKEVEDIATLKVDEFLDFSLRGSVKDKRVFEVTDKDDETFVVNGLVGLARTISYDYPYVCRVLSEGKDKIAEFKIKQVGTQNPIC